MLVIYILAFRFLISLLFGTTPGRKITGLRVVTDLGGFPVSRTRLAFREFLAGLFFSLPVVNIFWLALIVRHSRSPGMARGSLENHRRASDLDDPGPAISRALRAPAPPAPVIRSDSQPGSIAPFA